jgi:hypothetical protein
MLKKNARFKTRNNHPTEKPCPADKNGASNELPILPASPPIPLPDLETTVGAKLQKCKEMLKLMASGIVFQKYDEDELVCIVQSRIGSTIVGSRVIEFIASKVADTSGDASKVLEMAPSSQGH